MLNSDVILITGGSSGFGKATAKLFCESGAKVIITGRNAAKLDAAAKELGCRAVCADASKPEDWEKLVKLIKEEYGKIDLLFNCAGGGVAIKKLEAISPKEIDEIYATNLASATYGCSAFAPIFKAQKFGTIVNVSSVCAREAWPGWTVYAASKWGVLGLTKGLTTELGPHGVRVTCIIPGAGATNFDNAASFDRGEIPALKAEDIAQTVFGIYNLPKTVWVEEVTVWGMDQVVMPL